MTHEERVRHHTYDTLEGISEHAERIASLEELVLDMEQRLRWADEVMGGGVMDARIERSIRKWVVE